MKLTDLLNKSKEPIDVFVICDGGRIWLDDANKALGKKIANTIFFTPSATRKKIWKKQETEGKFNPRNSALIIDDSWFKGNAFKEVYTYLINQGYNPNKIYGYFALGKVSPEIKGPQGYCDTAENILEKFISEGLE